MTEKRGKIEAGIAIGPYVLEERVGSGGFGEVWTGRHREWTDRVCAFKFPRDVRHLSRLKTEADVLRSLEHDAIVRIEEVDTQCDTPYLRMAYVSGENLGDLVDREEKLAPSEAVRIARYLCEALAYAHDKGVLHRDIKPANVLLAEDGAVKLTDFGVALITGEDRPALEGSLDTKAAKDEAQAGTLEYMAPEIRRGAEHTAASDLYSLGVLLYRCLAGRLPRSLQPPSHFNDAVPPALDRLVARLLDPVEERYSAALEVIDDLETCLVVPERDSAEPAPTPSQTPPVPEPHRAGTGEFIAPAWGEVIYALCVVALVGMAINFRAVTPVLAFSLMAGLLVITAGASRFSRSPVMGGLFWAGITTALLGGKLHWTLTWIGACSAVIGGVLWVAKMILRPGKPSA